MVRHHSRFRQRKNCVLKRNALLMSICCYLKPIVDDLIDTSMEDLYGNIDPIFMLNDVATAFRRDEKDNEIDLLKAEIARLKAEIDALQAEVCCCGFICCASKVEK